MRADDWRHPRSARFSESAVRADDWWQPRSARFSESAVRADDWWQPRSAPRHFLGPRPGYRRLAPCPCGSIRTRAVPRQSWRSLAARMPRRQRGRCIRACGVRFERWAAVQCSGTESDSRSLDQLELGGHRDVASTASFDRVFLHPVFLHRWERSGVGREVLPEARLPRHGARAN